MQRIAKLNARRDELKAEIAELLPDGGIVGDSKVSVTHRRTLNSRLIEKEYPYEKYPAFYKHTLNTTAVRQALGTERLEKFQAKESLTVTVKDAA